MKSMIWTIGISLLLIVGYYLGRSYYLKPGLVQGQKAFEFVDKLGDGTSFSLADLKGRYVLLDFWGTWCGPCLQSHPALVELYKQFHGKAFKDGSDFEMVSVAVENNDRSWQRIIQQDQLNWPYHLVALNLFNSPIVKAYGVKQLPTTFLINPQGVIIGVDLPMHQIVKLLHSKLKEPLDGKND
ncbi:MAG: TlpA family protein disulfide reductase [Saprospiraceae bacterium]|uniref:TlpA family protein disulfide reductase n=1 Tax=Candidatus Opimibacter skivensis TaxID=2982028 RepID=A0A9D7XTG5_9BACT|nr:TlpA family protein disulfide reductase [Candidatus Opimibacter skivensis]